MISLTIQYVGQETCRARFGPRLL